MNDTSNNAPKQDGLKDAFEGIRADGENGDELFFDPATGELRTARTAEDPDRIPATQMAREGFFLRESDEALARLPLCGEPRTSAPSPEMEHEELVFDGETGELQAAGEVEAEDRVPATQMAREGFF